MGLLKLGFGEIRRKYRRFMLRRQMRSAAQVRTQALRNLGQRAAESGETGAADAGLVVALSETQAKDRQLGSQLSALDEKIRGLEAERDADAARFKALDDEVMRKKAPLDAELAAQQKAATRGQREADDIRRRLQKAQQERQAPEQSLAKPATAGAAADRAKAEARLDALMAERPGLEAQQARLAEAGALAAREAEKLKAEVTPLQAELDRIGAERREASERVKRALADLRKESAQVRGQAADVSRQRDGHFEALGAALAAAGAVSPALGAELGAVSAATQAQAALQSSHDASLAESAKLPKWTMAKFSGLALAATAALGAGGYAATQAAKSVPRPATLAEECRMPSWKKKPVKADPGGPYNVVRAGEATLDGSRSKGSCLKYAWTFAPAPKDALDGPRPASGNAEDDGLFAIVDQLACPEGQGGNAGARKTGRTAKARFLCTLKVTLTVTDGATSDSRDVIVKVKPRGPNSWQVSIDKAQADGVMTGSKLVRDNLKLGLNVCAIDGSPTHALHAGASWQGEGYGVAPLQDPDGPFDGWWYIDKSTLRIKRSALINPDLAAASALHKRNVDEGYKDFDVLRQVVQEHERLHGTMIFEEMEKIRKEGHDPAKIIEALSVKKDAQARLVEWADMAIRQVEGRLSPGQELPEYAKIHQEIKARLAKNPRFNRAGKVLFPDVSGHYGEYPIPNFANAGEDGG